jgi:hypothetical protein
MKYYEIVVAAFLAYFISFIVLLLLRRPLSGILLTIGLVLLLGLYVAPALSLRLNGAGLIILVSVFAAFIFFLVSGNFIREFKKPDQGFLYFGVFACIIFILLLAGAVAGNPLVYLM